MSLCHRAAQILHSPSDPSSLSSSSLSTHPIQQIANPEILRTLIEKSVGEIVTTFKAKVQLEAEVVDLENEMDEISEKSSEFQDLKTKLVGKEEEVEKLSELLEKVEHALIDILNSSFKNKVVFRHLPVRFSRSPSLPKGKEEEQIKFMQGLMINNLQNVSLYLKKVEQTLEKIRR